VVGRHGVVHGDQGLHHPFGRAGVQDGQQVEVTALGGEVAADIGAVPVQPVQLGIKHRHDLGSQPCQYGLDR